ncbi:MAG: hypothetical protein IT363_07095 [Methanoregulaceae archaeon]|nr:hypothetical protein [Methanoregulaceae archaeon]
MTIADELPENYPTLPTPLEPEPFIGEYFIEQHIHFGVNNFYHEGGKAHLIVNARGGTGCGAVRQLHIAPAQIVSIAGVWHETRSS